MGNSGLCQNVHQRSGLCDNANNISPHTEAYLGSDNQFPVEDEYISKNIHSEIHSASHKLNHRPNISPSNSVSQTYYYYKEPILDQQNPEDSHPKPLKQSNILEENLFDEHRFHDDKVKRAGNIKEQPSSSPYKENLFELYSSKYEFISTPLTDYYLKKYDEEKLKKSGETEKLKKSGENDEKNSQFFLNYDMFHSFGPGSHENMLKDPLENQLELEKFAYNFSLKKSQTDQIYDNDLNKIPYDSNQYESTKKSHEIDDNSHNFTQNHYNSIDENHALNQDLSKLPQNPEKLHYNDINLNVSDMEDIVKHLMENKKDEAISQLKRSLLKENSNYSSEQINSNIKDLEELINNIFQAKPTIEQQEENEKTHNIAQNHNKKSIKKNDENTNINKIDQDFESLIKCEGQSEVGSNKSEEEIVERRGDIDILMENSAKITQKATISPKDVSMIQESNKKPSNFTISQDLIENLVRKSLKNINEALFKKSESELINGNNDFLREKAKTYYGNKSNNEMDVEIMRNKAKTCDLEKQNSTKLGKLNERIDEILTKAKSRSGNSSLRSSQNCIRSEYELRKAETEALFVSAKSNEIDALNISLKNKLEGDILGDNNEEILVHSSQEKTEIAKKAFHNENNEPTYRTDRARTDVHYYKSEPALKEANLDKLRRNTDKNSFNNLRNADTRASLKIMKNEIFPEFSHHHIEKSPKKHENSNILENFMIKSEDETIKEEENDKDSSKLSKGSDEDILEGDMRVEGNSKTSKSSIKPKHSRPEIKEDPNLEESSEEEHEQLKKASTVSKNSMKSKVSKLSDEESNEEVDDKVDSQLEKDLKISKNSIKSKSSRHSDEDEQSYEEDHEKPEENPEMDKDEDVQQDEEKDEGKDAEKVEQDDEKEDEQIVSKFHQRDSYSVQMNRLHKKQEKSNIDINENEKIEEEPNENDQDSNKWTSFSPNKQKKKRGSYFVQLKKLKGELKKAVSIEISSKKQSKILEIEEILEGKHKKSVVFIDKNKNSKIIEIEENKANDTKIHQNNETHESKAKKSILMNSSDNKKFSKILENNELHEIQLEKSIINTTSANKKQSKFIENEEIQESKGKKTILHNPSPDKKKSQNSLKMEIPDNTFKNSLSEKKESLILPIDFKKITEIHNNDDFKPKSSIKNSSLDKKISKLLDNEELNQISSNKSIENGSKDDVLNENNEIFEKHEKKSIDHKSSNKKTSENIKESVHFTDFKEGKKSIDQLIESSPKNLAVSLPKNSSGTLETDQSIDMQSKKSLKNEAAKAINESDVKKIEENIELMRKISEKAREQSVNEGDNDFRKSGSEFFDQPELKKCDEKNNKIDENDISLRKEEITERKKKKTLKIQENNNNQNEEIKENNSKKSIKHVSIHQNENLSNSNTQAKIIEKEETKCVKSETERASKTTQNDRFSMENCPSIQEHLVNDDSHHYDAAEDEKSRVRNTYSLDIRENDNEHSSSSDEEGVKNYKKWDKFDPQKKRKRPLSFMTQKPKKSFNNKPSNFKSENNKKDENDDIL